ncbi:HS3ST5 family protein [Megaselia abdita]
MTAKKSNNHLVLGDCSVKLPLDILWLPKSAMRPVGPETSQTDCILVVGISRPKLAAVFITVMLISLFLTFHVLYDSAVYNIHAAQVISEQKFYKILNSNNNNHHKNYEKPQSKHPNEQPQTHLYRHPNQQPSDDLVKINHPMIFPNRVHFPKTSRRLPQSLIIGVRKCGTRALLEMLYLHPSIQKAGGEVHFFDRDENYLKGLDWYRKKMPHSFRGQITIEKSPSYFVSPEVPERVRAMNATIKLLLIVREPVTRAISDFTQLRSHGITTMLPPSSFDQIPDSSIAKTDEIYFPGTTQASGTSANLASLSSKTFEELAIFPNGTVNESYRPLTISMYHLYLHRWLEVFPREQLLVVNGDRLIDDPLSQMKKIENFLGIDHRITRNHFYFNETKGFYCLRYDSGDRCLRETKGRKHPHVDPLVISKLRKFFAEHNQRFYELVGEDLGWPEE